MRRDRAQNGPTEAGASGRPTQAGPEEARTPTPDTRTTVQAGRVRLQARDQDEAVYDAVLVTPGRIQQDDGEPSDWLIPAHVLQEAVARGLFSGLPHYVDHPDQFGFGWHQRPSVRDLAGIATDAEWDPQAGAVRAARSLYDTEAGRLLAALYDQIIDDKAAGRDVPPLGLSITCYRQHETDEETGLRTWTNIQKVSSVDAVYEPGAAGYIRAALSALQDKPTNAGRDLAPQLREPTRNSQASLQNTGGTMSEETRSQTSTAEAPTASEEQTQESSIEQNIAALNRAVDRLNGLLAQQEETRTVQDMGEAPRGPMLYGGLQGLDQVQLAVEAMIQGTRPPDGVRPLTGIRQLYMLLSGDYELTGRFHDDRIYLANVNTSTMANIVADALNKVVINMFQEYDQWWNLGVSVQDFASLQDAKWITLGGVGELPTVAEGAPTLRCPGTTRRRRTPSSRRAVTSGSPWRRSTRMTPAASWPPLAPSPRPPGSRSASRSPRSSLPPAAAAPPCRTATP